MFISVQCSCMCVHVGLCEDINACSIWQLMLDVVLPSLSPWSLSQGLPEPSAHQFSQSNQPGCIGSSVFVSQVLELQVVLAQLLGKFWNLHSDPHTEPFPQFFIICVI